MPLVAPIVTVCTSSAVATTVTLTSPAPMLESDSSAVCTADADAGAVSGDAVVWPLNSRLNVPPVAPIVMVCTSSAVAARLMLTLPEPMLERDSSAVVTVAADAPTVTGDAVVCPLNSRSNVPPVAPIVTVCTSSVSTSAVSDGTVICATSPFFAAPENVTVYIDVRGVDASSVTVAMSLLAIDESDSRAVCTAEAEAPTVSADAVVWPLNCKSKDPLVAVTVMVCTSSVSTSAAVDGTVIASTSPFSDEPVNVTV